jgi:hypothetical protein
MALGAIGTNSSERLTLLTLDLGRLEHLEKWKARRPCTHEMRRKYEQAVLLVGGGGREGPATIAPGH